MKGPAQPPAKARGSAKALLATYAPPAGGYDEMLAADGSVRPHYRPLIEALAAMTPAERAGRFGSAGQYLREAGVFYRVYGGSDARESERGWPLAHPPLVVETGEWAALEAGLLQRATFLERVLGDLYGARSLIASGKLPSAILGQNPEFLRPLASQGLSGDPMLRFMAVDLGRGPDGRWWVLGDRTQAPSGAGFSLENRVATARGFPEINASMKVRRLAGFFQRFRDTLVSLNGQSATRVGVLTPGPLNETYFEHAYLARYLGFLLLEGGDLVVHGNRVEVRTVDGFKPLQVLWRRLDSDFADPLELFPQSRIGTPGLVRAVRAGTVTMVNALGSGILETRALLAFQPALAEALLGEDLALPTIATWWGGQAAERAHIAAHRGRLSLARAFPDTVGSAERRSHLDLGLRRTAPEALLAEFEADGSRVIGQEMVSLSTAPVFIDGALVARPVTMRVFLARDGEGWHVMPGGFARVSDDPEARAMSMQAGGRSIDVWVSSTQESRPVTLLGPPAERFLRRLPGALPSRAADNLFWLGRYTERAEVATRLLRLYAGRQAEGRPIGPLEERIAVLLKNLGVDVAKPLPARGILKLTGYALGTASRIRDRFSPDGWRTLSEIVDMLEAATKSDEDGDPIALTSSVLTRLSGFTGLVRENMYQFTGWRFLECGRHIERGLMTAVVASACTSGEAEGAYEALLEFTDSRVTYRRRYTVALSGETVLDLSVLDPFNPRSIAYQVDSLKDAVERLPGVLAGESLDMLSRRLARLQVRLATGSSSEVDGPFLDRVVQDLYDISDLISQRYFVSSPDIPLDRQDNE